MKENEIGFYQDRINKAYQEQIWITAIMVAMNGFIIENSGKLVPAVKPLLFYILLFIILLLAVGTILIKHFTFIRFNKKLISIIPDESKSSEKLLKFKKMVALLAGVITYILITCITTFFSFACYCKNVQSYNLGVN